MLRRWGMILLLTVCVAGCGGDGDKDEKGKGDANGEAQHDAAQHDADQHAQHDADQPPKNGENGKNGKQTSVNGQPTASGLDLKYVLADFDAAVVVQPRRALNSKLLSQLDTDFMVEQAREEMGIDVRQVERVLVLAKVPPTEALGPGRAKPKDLPRQFEKKGFEKAPDIKEEAPDEADSRSEAPALDERNLQPVAFLQDKGKAAPFSKGAQPPAMQGGRPEEPSVVVTFSEAVDRKAILAKAPPARHGMEKTHDGYTYWAPQGPFGGPALCFPDSKTMIVSPEATLKKMLDGEGGKSSPLVDRLKTVDLANDLIVVADLTPHQEAARKVAQQAGQAAPPQVMPYVEQLEQLKTVVVMADLSDETLLQIDLDARTGEAAGELETALGQGKQQLEAMVGQFKQFTAQSPDESLKQLVDLGESTLAGLSLSSEGTTVQIRLAAPEDWTPVVAALQKAIEEARDAAKLTERKNDLRQIGIAFHNFHDVQSGFPAAAAYVDAEGQPLLSWRVALLPMLEENALYEQFNLDEPWDSPHNKALLEQMPEVYQTPGAEAGHTSIVAVVGENTGIVPKASGEAKAGVQIGTQFRDITDGTSNTVLVVQAGAEKAVPWTKPADIAFDAEKVREALGESPEGGFLVLFADGSVRVIGPDVPAETLKNLMLRNDGQAVNPFELQ